MKKNSESLILFSLILCFICFLNNWFGDEIIARLFIFSVIINLILFIIYIILVIKTIKSDNKLFIEILILMIIPILSFIDFRLYKTKIELDKYMDERLEIIEMVKNNELEYYFEKNIKLPKYKNVSQDGEIYVYQNDEEQVIGFWVFRGMQSGSTELIYSSKGEELIKENETGHPIIEIKKLKDNWYYVITDY